MRLERGALSNSQFPTFSKKVIPFLHITTRIKGQKYDNLLGEKGFGGFPSLAFMDAKGNVLGKPSDRTVKGFNATFDLLNAHMQLVTRIEKGEKGLEFELFISEYNLGKVSGKAAITRAKALENLTEAQQKRVAQLVLDEEVLGLIKRAMNDEDELAPVSKRFVELLDARTLPSKEVILDFWAILAYTSEQAGDATLLSRCIEGLRTGFPKREDVQKWANELETKHKALGK